MQHSPIISSSIKIRLDSKAFAAKVLSKGALLAADCIPPLLIYFSKSE